MKVATSTRQRILDQGLATISKAGFEGITLGSLATQVGMSKSGLFAHFRSKEEVQLSLLEYAASVAANRIIVPAMRTGKGLLRIKSLIRNWFGWLLALVCRTGAP